MWPISAPAGAVRIPIKEKKKKEKDNQYKLQRPMAIAIILKRAICGFPLLLRIGMNTLNCDLLNGHFGTESVPDPLKLSVEITY